MNDNCEVCDQFIGYPVGSDHEHCVECQERIPFDNCDGDVDENGHSYVIAGSTKGKEIRGSGWECNGCIRFRKENAA